MNRIRTALVVTGILTLVSACNPNGACENARLQSCDDTTERGCTVGTPGDRFTANTTCAQLGYMLCGGGYARPSSPMCSR